MARPATAAVRLLTGEREPVRLATTANITLYGLQTIDAVAAEVGDRVLVKNQADQTQNGIYTASEGQWYRAADARTARTMQKGTTVHVQAGATNAGKTFVFNTDSPVVGDTAIVIGFYISDTAVTDAQTAAMAAASSASTASTSATNAASSASAASTSATNAASSATAASGSATSAATSATNAGNSATAAAGSASNASTSTTNAANSAISAATSATNAGNSSTAAASSATAAAGSAATIDYLVVVDRTALKAVSTAAHTAVKLKEAGREGDFIWTTGDFSTQIAADTAEGIYIKANAIASTAGAWVRKSGWHVQGADIRWFGGKADYNPTTKVGTSMHPAINAAFAVVQWVVLPVGNMLLTDTVVLAASADNPKKLTGSGRDSSFVYVNNTFNLSATGVIQFTGNGYGHSMGQFSLVCQDQPDDPTLANYVQYPPIVSAVGITRFEVYSMLIQEAIIGIDMTGNTGGSTLIDVQMSAYSKGVKVDGALDSIRVNRFHWWPFGFPAVTNKRAVYATARCLEILRADDFNISSSLFFSSVQAVYCGTGTGGANTVTINGCDFDDRGGLVVDAGWVSVAGCMFTLGKTDSRLIVVNGGRLSVASSYLLNTVNSAVGAAIDCGAGTLVLTGCNIEAGNADTTICRINGTGEAIITGNRWSRTDGISYTNQLINISGASVTGAVSGNTATPLATGGSVFVAVGNSAAKVTVTGNNTPYAGTFGWRYNLTVPLNNNVIIDNNTGRNGRWGETISVLAADLVKADVATVQNVFDTTQDEILVEAATAYEFEAQYQFSRSAGTTSHTFATLFGGTATLMSIDYVAEVINPTGNVLANVQMLHVTAATAAVLTAANTSATEYVTVKLRGILRINAEGTIIPQFQLSAAAGGAPTVKRDSFFRLKSIGSNTMMAKGPWF